ncbi:MAG: AmmeMemoRadiSam system protein A [Magnetococcus sp. DMHC-6]
MVAFALRDPRFAPLQAEELEEVQLEVSLLTPPVALAYQDPTDLLAKLKPGVHGVILAKNGHRATFLPQVWEQLPNTIQFLEHLCRKAGLTGHCWQEGVEIAVYTVEKILDTKRS